MSTKTPKREIDEILVVGGGCSLTMARIVDETYGTNTAELKFPDSGWTLADPVRMKHTAWRGFEFQPVDNLEFLSTIWPCTLVRLLYKWNSTISG